MKAIQDLNKMLQIAKRKDLIAFTLDYAEENASFKKDLMAYLGKKYIGNKKTIKEYRKEMSVAFSQAKDVGNRWSGLEIADWDSILKKAGSLLDEGQKLLDLGNADAAASMAVEYFVSFHKVFDEDTFFDENDYEDFDTGGSCESAEDLLLDAIAHPSITLSVQKELVGELRNLSKTDFAYNLNNYGIFDFDDMLLQVNINTQTPEDTLQMLDVQIDQHKEQYDEYVYVERKIDLLQKIHRLSDAEKVEQKYIDIPEIRHRVIDGLISRKEFEDAVKCLHEGIDAALKEKHPGIVDQWKKLELEIYEKLGDKLEQISMCRELFISARGSMEYYHKLKLLVPKGDWKGYLKNLLEDAKIKNNVIFGSSILADIFVEEKDSESLYQFIRKQTYDQLIMLDHYSRFVNDDHAEELLALYTCRLKNEAEQNVNSRAYRRMANSMENMKKLKNGNSAVHQLAEYFRKTYYRRPSMMAEMKKF
ncbi:hypothetical protein LPYR103PRE_06700 [Segatella asaccharophila]